MNLMKMKPQYICQSTNNFIPNNLFQRFKHKSINSGRSLQGNNPKLDELIAKNGLACASTPVPIFTIFSVPNSNIIESNELKAPIAFNREAWCRMEGSKKENRMGKDLGRRTSLKVYRNIEDSRETMF